jgi:hypothetical protein
VVQYAATRPAAERLPQAPHRARRAVWGACRAAVQEQEPLGATHSTSSPRTGLRLETSSAWFRRDRARVSYGETCAGCPPRLHVHTSAGTARQTGAQVESRQTAASACQVPAPGAWHQRARQDASR